MPTPVSIILYLEWQCLQAMMPPQTAYLQLPSVVNSPLARRACLDMTPGTPVAAHADVPVFLLQTGQYSTQIFSLAVLLSSLFVYNQMGGIDEAALDRLSLVTEMTKHIRVRSGDSGTVAPC